MDQLGKSTVSEIRERFDNDVERFADLESGQVSTIDASLSLELITEAAARLAPGARNLLDIGCGAGNYTLKMLSKRPGLDCTLLDLSGPMLKRAERRVSAAGASSVSLVQADIREAALPENRFDIILAGAVLHHLRDNEDWESVFAKLHRLLRPGGCLMISDLVTQEDPALHDFIWGKYGDYLEEVGGAEYRQKVFEYIGKEDSPRSLVYQLHLMEHVGFSRVEVLHKHLCFAAFGGVK